MAKGKTKNSIRSEDSAPARSLRSRKREAKRNDAGQTAKTQAPLQLKGVEEVRTTAKPLQECAVLVQQLNQSVEQSCLTRPDETIKEKTDESEVNSLSTAASKSSNESQAERWADEDAIDHGSKRQQGTAMVEIHRSTEQMFTDELQASQVCEASSTSVDREMEGQQEQQESATAFPAKKRRRMGSCGLTEGERSRILGSREKKPSCGKDDELKVCFDSMASDTPLRSSSHESGKKQAEQPKAKQKLVELQQTEQKQAELQQTELQHMELQKVELQQVEKNQAELQQAELQQAELQQVELQQVELQQVELKQTGLQQVELQQVELKQTGLQQVELQQVELKQTGLQQVELQQAELQQAELQQVELQQVELKQTGLQQAELQQAELQQAELQQVELQQVELQQVELKQTGLQQVELQQVELKQTGLQQVELQQTESQQAGLQNAELKQAELQQAELQQVELQQVELQQAELQHAVLQQAVLQQAVLQQAELQQARLQKAEPKQAEQQHAGDNGRAPTEPLISFLYRADPDSVFAPQREHLKEDLQGAKAELEESSRQHPEEDAPPQTADHAEETTSSTEAPISGQSCGSAQPPAQTPADSEQTRNGGPADGPAAALSSGRDSHGARGCSDYVSDSQLNAIVFTEELMDDEYCLEDATDLLCGIISELSSMNRRVMAAHRELENLRRSRKASRNSAY